MAVNLVGNMWQLGSAELDSARYLLTDDRYRPIVIDPGSVAGLELLEEELAAFNYELIDPLYFATHCHDDHASVTAEIDGAVTGIGWYDFDALQSADPGRMAHFIYPDRPSPRPNKRLLVLEEGISMKVGESVLHILETPGHTPGSICFDIEVEDERVLVAGDTLHGGCSPRIGSDLSQWRQSLAKLRTIPFTKLTFGHGIDYLVDDAQDHLTRAEAQFGRRILPSHPDANGVYRYENPWSFPWEQVVIDETVPVLGALRHQAEIASQNVPKAV